MHPNDAHSTVLTACGNLAIVTRTHITARDGWHLLDDGGQVRVAVQTTQEYGFFVTGPLSTGSDADLEFLLDIDKHDYQNGRAMPRCSRTTALCAWLDENGGVLTAIEN